MPPARRRVAVAVAEPRSDPTGPAGDRVSSTGTDGVQSAGRCRSAQGAELCCPRYHQAVELVGKRWSGAILGVLVERDAPMRFSEIAQAVPQLSDRLLSERMKELEARGIVERRVHPEPPVRVEYALTDMGRDLSRALGELKAWARRWL